MFEVMLGVGVLMVIGSIVMLATVQYTRSWFFENDQRRVVQPVRVRAYRDPRY